MYVHVFGVLPSPPRKWVDGNNHYVVPPESSTGTQLHHTAICQEYTHSKHSFNGIYKPSLQLYMAVVSSVFVIFVLNFWHCGLLFSLTPLRILGGVCSATNEKVWVRHSYRNCISLWVLLIRPACLFTAYYSSEKQTLETQLCPVICGSGLLDRAS